MTEKSNKQKQKDGMKFEEELYKMFRDNDIPYVKKPKFSAWIRNGVITVEPDCAFYRPKLWLCSIKLSVRERWRNDIVYEKIHPHAVDKIVLITKDTKHPKDVIRFYDHVFIMPRDQARLLTILKEGERGRNTLHRFQNYFC